MTEGISQKVLNEKLRELENDRLVSKQVYAKVPPKVEYSPTDKGLELATILKEIGVWSSKHYPDLDNKCK